jgi:hypothetical protein
MKTFRKVMGSLGIVTAYNLECGHIIYRRWTPRGKIPDKLQCELCERDAIERFEQQRAYQHSRTGAFEEVRKLLDLCVSKVSNDPPSDSGNGSDETKRAHNEDGPTADR